jgi:hypothetical protein
MIGQERMKRGTTASLHTHVKEELDTKNGWCYAMTVFMLFIYLLALVADLSCHQRHCGHTVIAVIPSATSGRLGFTL